MLFLVVITMQIYIILKQSMSLYETLNLGLFIAKIIMIIIGVIVTCMSLKILFRRGTNQSLKWVALSRQFTQLFLFLFWHTMFSIFFYDSNLLTKINMINLSKRTIRFISIYMQVIGIPSAIIRLTEPFVWFKVSSSLMKIAQWFKNGCQSRRSLEVASKLERKSKTIKLKQQIKDASICSFLNSAMNIEYVYMILQGIEKLMANQQMMDSISRR